MNEPLLLSVKDICSLLGVSQYTLYRIRMRDDTFPKPVELGNCHSKVYRFDRELFEQWYRRQTNTAAQAASDLS